MTKVATSRERDISVRFGIMNYCYDAQPALSTMFLTCYVLMDSSFLFDAVNLGWSIVYIEGSQIKLYFFL